jgi:hypothetical protein
LTKAIFDLNVMKDKLTTQSLSAGQRAIRHYLNKEHDQFLMQAAICFELLGKARLATIHPSLIVDRDFDSFLHVCAEGKHSKRAPWNIKTINATEVLQRCIQLHPGLNDFNRRLRLLAEFRNSAIHLGEVVEDERKEIFHEFLASTSLVVDAMAIPREDFFGEFADLVAAHLDESLTEVNRVTAEKLATAKTEYERKYGSLDPTHTQGIVTSIESGYDLRRYEDQLAVCPACENQGVLGGSIDVDWQADYDRYGEVEGAYPVVTLTPSSFFCDLCGLSLDGSAELKAAGLGDPVHVEDVDPKDFYDEPDYDY